MSKKKAASTMSLKDFHGGSIPSDIPLPSAPGVILKSSSDRNMSTNWGNNPGKSDLRPRPSSSGATSNLDEKASFFSHPTPIGRNFDEDERNPLNGPSAPRQTISNVSFQMSCSIPQETKQDYVSSMKASDRPVTSPSLGAGSSSLRVGGGNSFAVNSQTSISSAGLGIKNVNTSSGVNGKVVNNSQPNAWGLRKEVTTVNETAQAPDALSKIAPVSALEKVSSGMWQSKNPSQFLPHLLYSRDNNSNNNAYGCVNVVNERDVYDASLRSQDERGQIGEDGTRVRGTESPKMYTEDVNNGDNNGRSLLPPTQMSEQPRLKLRSRSGPLETSEEDFGQGYRQTVVANKVESVNELYKNTNSSKPCPTVSEGGSQMVERPVERPKLNLKPRSQPLDQSDGNIKRERQSLFGGARPRELVLKERGIDDIAFNNLDLGHAPNRVNSPKNEVASERLVPSTGHYQNTETVAYDKRSTRNFEREEQQMGRGRDDNQGRNRQIESRWGGKDALKQQQELRPEPDTWRKPFEEPKPSLHDATGNHHGKVVSALDLTRAFSKSASNPKPPEQHSTQTGRPGNNNHVPFSRLTDNRELNSAPSNRHRHRINGY
ncbi:hypothetical protein Ddye_018176 [Dipteronia dyeriana]|uniref:Uncharacterized protein n=1 Tax=Dipteronia dyeriana TaxID=168575 RepID=A0AAD9X1R7_9ROSI|nr:hypothetical protein Ddye_018176 [Dipteronia dyeriana]